MHCYLDRPISENGDYQIIWIINKKKCAYLCGYIESFLYANICLRLSGTRAAKIGPTKKHLPIFFLGYHLRFIVVQKISPAIRYTPRLFVLFQKPIRIRDAYNQFRLLYLT